MFRFKATLALVAMATGSFFQIAAKEKPPQISVCDGAVCLTDLRWTQPDSFLGTTEPAVDGVLVNNANVTVSHSSLRFALEAGPAVLGTAFAYYSGPIPPGGQWHFHADFTSMIGGRFVMTIHSVELSYAEDNGRRVSEALEFDPLFSPVAGGQRRAWEKIYGKRQR